MDWESISTVAGLAVAAIVIAVLIFDVFSGISGIRRYLAERSVHATVSTTILFILSLINFMLLFGHAWNGDPSFDYVVVLCVLAFFANLYASWSQPQMVWKGGLILCWIILVVLVFSPCEDEPVEILSFWLGRGFPIYFSAAAGGVISHYLLPGHS